MSFVKEHRFRLGFTLIELLVVIAIIAILEVILFS
jgi:prepilin-type N-terminal cleavage/methylation domain-containing protein